MGFLDIFRKKEKDKIEKKEETVVNGGNAKQEKLENEDNLIEELEKQQEEYKKRVTNETKNISSQLEKDERMMDDILGKLRNVNERKYEQSNGYENSKVEMQEKLLRDKEMLRRAKELLGETFQDDEEIENHKTR